MQHVTLISNRGESFVRSRAALPALRSNQAEDIAVHQETGTWVLHRGTGSGNMNYLNHSQIIFVKKSSIETLTYYHHHNHYHQVFLAL